MSRGGDNGVCLGGRWERRRVEPLAPKANHFGQIGPRRYAALTAGVNHASQEGQRAAALLAASTQAEFA